jgi:hypothetical protein
VCLQGYQFDEEQSTLRSTGRCGTADRARVPGATELIGIDDDERLAV